MVRGRRKPALSFALVAAALVVSPRKATALDLPELAALAKPSVVLLTVADEGSDKASLGTGFFVSKDGRIVTNHHVIEGATKITASLSDGRTIDVIGVLADDAVRDIAVIQATPGAYAPLTLGTSATLRVGDEVAILGSPLGLSSSLSTGIVSAMRERGPTTPFDLPTDSHFESWGIQVTAAISHGSSGSPIMNRTGEVVAVAVGIHAGGEGLGFGVPVEVAKSLVNALPPNAAPKPFARASSHPVLRDLGISAAVFAVPYLAFVSWRRRERRRSGK